jgi:hypothetical protein
VGKFVDTRGKITALTDQFYVSPYLLRPLRRLEEVEREAALKKDRGKKRAASAAKDAEEPRGRRASGTEK